MVEFHIDVPFEEFYGLSEYVLRAQKLLGLEEANAQIGPQRHGDREERQ
jgi:hypothetical protein